MTDVGRPAADPGRQWRQIAFPLLIVRIGGQGAEFVGWVILARRFGTDDFGALSVAFLAARYTGLICDWGAAFRGARDVAAASAPESAHALVRARVRATALLAPTFAVATAALGRPGLAPLAVVVAALGLSRDWLALGNERGLRAGSPVLLQGAVMAASSAVFGRDDLIALPVAMGYGAGLALSLHLNRLPSDRPLERLAGPRPGAWLIVASLTNQVSTSLDTILVAAMRSTGEAGIYAAVYRIPNAWIAVLTLAMAGLVPVASRLASTQPREFDHLRRRSLSLATMTASAVLLAAVPLYWVVVPVFGDAFRSGQFPMAVLIGSVAVATAATPLHPLYLAVGSDRTYSLILGSGAAVNVATNLVMIPPLGIAGAAWATVASQLVVGIALFSAFRRRSGSLSPSTKGPVPPRGEATTE